MITTFGVRPALTFTDISDIVDAVQLAITETALFLAANIVTGWVYHGFEVVRATDTGDEAAEFVTTVTGVLVGGGFTSNTAILLQKRTGLGGRRHRGRMFFPPVLFGQDGADNNGFLTPALVTNLSTTFATFLSELAAAEVPMALHHSGTALDSQLVSSLEPAAQLATQRRRMRS